MRKAFSHTSTRATSALPSACTTTPPPLAPPPERIPPLLFPRRFLEQIIFPAFMQHQSTKISASGQVSSYWMGRGYPPVSPSDIPIRYPADVVEQVSSYGLARVWLGSARICRWVWFRPYAHT